MVSSFILRHISGRSPNGSTAIINVFASNLEYSAAIDFRGQILTSKVGTRGIRVKSPTTMLWRLIVLVLSIVVSIIIIIVQQYDDVSAL